MLRVSHRRPPLAPLVLAAALASAGCATTPAMRAAEEGRYEGVRALLAHDLEQGHLGDRAASSFARAVAKSEIARASGEDGVQRIRELRSCAREIGGALGDRADTRDTIGAAAALVLVEEGIASPSSFAKWAREPATGPRAAWRALGARALVGGDDGDLRRQMIADPDEEVRRGALRAALEAADPDDGDPVLEAARLDPSAPSRAQAIRAAGVIGGEHVVLALKDLWPRADVEVREAIVDAWSTYRSFNSGGRRELGWVIDAQRGSPAIHAAITLVTTGGEGSAEAAGSLERAVNEGPSADRALAISLVPLSKPALRDAVAQAEADADEAVSASAMARRLEAPADLGGAGPGSPARDAIIAKLLPIASGNGAGATIARGALARARVPALVPILERNGAAKEPKVRVEAGTSLAVLGDLPRAALIAADLEPRVRTGVACAILRAWAMK